MSSKNALLTDVQTIAGIQLLVDVEQGSVKLKDWAVEHRAEIEAWLQNQGALVIRGLKITSSRQFGQLLNQLFDGELLSYNHRSTPRTELRGNVYTATEYHSDQLIVQHNEQAYTNVWPMRLGFFCMLPSVEGGETPIADSREVYRRIPSAIREKFAAKGLMYVRNYSDLDLPWSEVFCTDDRQEVERYCDENNIEYQWFDNGVLRTKQKLQAVCKHPKSAEMLWFNQAHLFHVSSLEAEVRDELLSSVGKENLPRNTYYGDGTDIEEDVLELIRDIYEAVKVKFKWQKGDLLLLDNMLYSHGREPFAGERQTLVGMATACDAASMVPLEENV
jgi:alpha-ketoglutarate-dependent taurine dioxygenase